jgi:hypothetical protein
LPVLSGDLFVRTATRRNKDGSAVRYLQLVHNEWDPAAKAARMKVLHNFGREDQVDKAAIERLAGSLCRLLDPGRAAALREPGLSYQGSVAFGGSWLLDQLWQRLGTGAILAARLGKTRRGAAAERVLFALVANRALDPSSKLAAAHWAGRRAWIDRLPETTDDACYRAMDWLHQVKDPVEKEIFGQVADLLNLEVDLLFSGTTSTYFELDEEDEPVPRDKHGPVTGDEQKAAAGKPAGFRGYGKSKDHRDDLPQVVIGMAVTRGGIPARVWCWPGNTNDSALIRQVKDDMRDRTLSRVVWVADRGFTSAENRRYLRKGDHHYIIGEKLRSGSAEAAAALSRQGRYQDVAENLRVQVIDMRPACHRKEERIRAHVILCWLALLLIRLAETTAGTTWAAIAGEMDLLTLGTFTGPAGTFRQTAELTKTQRDLLAKLKIPHPKEDHRGNPGNPLTSSDPAG